MTPKKLSGERDDSPAIRATLTRTVLGAIAFILLAGVVIAGVRLATVWSFYAYLLHMVVQETGLDLRWARPLVLVGMALLTVVPWWSFVLPWRTGRRRHAFLAGLVVAGLSAGLAFTTQNVFFGGDGRPVRFYALVPGGFRLSDSPGIDRQYQIPYKPITPVVARQILAWEKAGGTPHMQPTLCGPAVFDLYTGEALCWYDQDREGHFRFSSVPGFDPENDAPLKAVTTDVVEQFQATARGEAKRRQITDSMVFRSLRIEWSDPPIVTAEGGGARHDDLIHLETGTQVVGQIVLPKRPPPLPAPDTPDGLIALAVQQASGLVPGERLLFRVTNNVLSGGSIVVPKLSVAEGHVTIWAKPGDEHTVIVGVLFFRLWLRPKKRPVDIRAHLVAERSLLASSAVNAICLDQEYPVP